MSESCLGQGTVTTYSPESTGKVERFNRTFEEFIQEVKLENPQTLEALNQWLGVWLDERYLHKPHQALGENTTPLEAYRNEGTPIRHVSAEELAHAFLHSETRKVDKAGCISFQDEKYEVGINFVGCKVEITYDPQDTNELTIDYPGFDSWTAKRLVISERTGKRPSLPEKMVKEPAGSSRLLKGAQRLNQERKAAALTPSVPAVSFRHIGKGVQHHV